MGDIVDYSYLVKRIAKKIHKKLPPHMELDDLISVGFIGLIDAIHKFKPSKGNFRTYASYRIRGAILDDLRAQDWVPRKMRKTENPTFVYDFEFVSEGASPFEVCYQAQCKNIFTEAIRSLPEHEMLSIHLFFYDNLTLKEIGRFIGLSESRVCQLQKIALDKLRSKLNARHP